MSAQIDVLAVLETQAAMVDWLTNEEIAGDPLRRVRAAVAELIEAIGPALYELRDKSEAKKDLIAALSRVKGA